MAVRNLCLILGDQLSKDSAIFSNFDKGQDQILMMEVDNEATYIPQHKQRLVFFFSAMRHFRDELLRQEYPLTYVELEDRNNRHSFKEEIKRWSNKYYPQKILVVHPGEYRVLADLEEAADELEIPLEVLEDNHFICGIQEFKEFAGGRKSLLLEHFYRHMRKKHEVLMEDGKPLGGQWNFDQDNRESFGKKGPPKIPTPKEFQPDETTHEVIKMVEKRFGDSPGQVEGFSYPVTRKQALAAVRDFIEKRLNQFGPFQDAMEENTPFVYHSRLSCVMNIHLVSPKEVIERVIAAFYENNLPINSVEGFVRQILGWREFIRGLYWLHMPEFAEMNYFSAKEEMPEFMWTGETEMNCLSDCVGQLNAYGYAHHIQRLMVMGLFSLLYGVRPYDVHRWHMSMYIDAVDWVSLPNVVGMSQFADGGIVGTKPYCASGNYVHRMSGYCKNCRYDPKKATGEKACPFTTLYWDFLMRNQSQLEGNRRLQFQYKNLQRKSVQERREIAKQAQSLKDSIEDNQWLNGG